MPLPALGKKMGEKANTPAATSPNATAQTRLGRRANETLVVANSCCNVGSWRLAGFIVPAWQWLISELIPDDDLPGLLVHELHAAIL